MVRVLSECKGAKAGGKAPRKSGSFKAGPSSANKMSKASKIAGGNPYCPRETPDWQKPITRFFQSNSDESTSGIQASKTCSAASENKGIDHGLEKDINEAGPSSFGGVGTIEMHIEDIEEESKGQNNLVNNSCSETKEVENDTISSDGLLAEVKKLNSEKEIIKDDVGEKKEIEEDGGPMPKCVEETKENIITFDEINVESSESNGKGDNTKTTT